MSANFNWKESPAHINLLAIFEKPHDVQQVLKWGFVREYLPEKVEVALDRLIREGMLIPASVEESLNKLFVAIQLKDLLSERSLSTSGSKVQLIERLVVHDLPGMTKIAGNTVMKCSDAALNLVTGRKAKIEKDTELTQQLTAEAIRAGNPKEACRIYQAFRRRTLNAAYEMSMYDVEELQIILTSHPKILSSLSAQDLKSFQLAACMKVLWKNVLVDKWLPESFTNPFKNKQIPMNYLTRNAEFRRDLSNIRQYSKKVKISFHNGDINSCSLCLALNGKELDIDKFPELPMIGCTSETGCLCNLESINYDDDDDDFDDDDGEVIFSADLTDQNLMLGENSMEALRLLKQMLDEGLITQSEYDEKKKEILSRL